MAEIITEWQIGGRIGHYPATYLEYALL